MVTNLVWFLNIRRVAVKQKLNINAMELFSWYFEVTVNLWLDTDLSLQVDCIKNDLFIKVEPLSFPTSYKSLLDHVWSQIHIRTLASIFVLDGRSYEELERKRYLLNTQGFKHESSSAIDVSVKHDERVSARSDDTTEN